MDSKLPGTTEKIRWTDLLNEYKYRPAQFLAWVDTSEALRSAIEAAFGTALQDRDDWPTELRSWKIVLIAMMENEIGSIWSPSPRAAAHEELLAAGRKWGVTPLQVRMVSLDLDSIYQRIRDEHISVPEDRNIRPGKPE